MKIGVDIDEVLGEFLGLLIELHNIENSTSIQVESISKYSLESLFCCTKQEIDRRIERFFKQGHGDRIMPVQGAAEAIRELTMDHELIVISARPKWFKQQTLHWLNRNFPGAFSEAHFVDEESLDANAGAKAQLCRELGIDVMIEDSHSNALACSRHVEKVFLLDRPWNRSGVSGNVSRVHAWADIVESIRLMSKKPVKIELVSEENRQDIFTFNFADLCSYLP